MIYFDYYKHAILPDLERRGLLSHVIQLKKNFKNKVIFTVDSKQSDGVLKDILISNGIPFSHRTTKSLKKDSNYSSHAFINSFISDQDLIFIIDGNDLDYLKLFLTHSEENDWEALLCFEDYNEIL